MQGRCIIEVGFGKGVIVQERRLGEVGRAFLILLPAGTLRSASKRDTAGGISEANHLPLSQRTAPERARR